MTEIADIKQEPEYLYRVARDIVVREQRVSVSFVQRSLGLGYNQAARLVERMVAEGVVTDADMTGKRTVLIASPTA